MAGALALVVSHMVTIGHAVTAPAAAEDDIIANLPSCGPPPTSYEDCIASGTYDLMGCSAKDRAGGEYHSVSVLHVPGKATASAPQQAHAISLGQRR